MRHTISTGSTAQNFAEQPLNNAFVRNSLPANQQVQQLIQNNKNYEQVQQLRQVQPKQQVHPIHQTPQIRIPQHFPQSQIQPQAQTNPKVFQQALQSPPQQASNFQHSNQPHNMQINPTL